MLVNKEYDRTRAVAYARRWALSRNPLYFDYAGIGGNCTNFVSQSLYAGSCTMNYTPTFGWYYLSPAERTASWTGVNYFYNFLTGNRSVGPYGREVTREELEPGDIIQLGREVGGYYHSLLLLSRDETGELYVAAQSDDALDRPLSSYTYDYARYLHVDGVRLDIPDTGDCFAALIAGEAILPNAASLPPLRPEQEPLPPEESAPGEGVPEGSMPEGSVPEGSAPDGSLPALSRGGARGL